MAAADTLQALAIDARGYLTGNAAGAADEATTAMREDLNLKAFCAGATDPARHVRFRGSA